MFDVLQHEAVTEQPELLQEVLLLLAQQVCVHVCCCGVSNGDVLACVGIPRLPVSHDFQLHMLWCHCG